MAAEKNSQKTHFALMPILILCLFVFSCTKNSEEMNLKGVLDYNWDTSIENVEKDFNKKKYSEIEISKAEAREAEIEIDSEYLYSEDVVSDYISAKMNYNDSPALITIKYFNKQMFNGNIAIDEVEKDEISKIEEKQIIEFKKKYGEPQETEDDSKSSLYNYRKSSVWRFRNNFSLYVGAYCFNLQEAKCTVNIIFTNNSLSKEKWAANKQKIEEIKEKRRVEEEAKKLQWMEENKEKIKGKVKGKLTISRDDFKEIKWINSTHRKAGNILEKLYLYIGVFEKSKNVTLRMVIDHTASSDRCYNIYNKYEFKIDDKRETLKPESDEKINCGYEYGDYYEKFDANISSDESRVMLLKDIASSKKTIVRFEGKQSYKDREISKKEKEGIEAILLTYEYLKNGGSLEDIL